MVIVNKINLIWPTTAAVKASIGLLAITTSKFQIIITVFTQRGQASS